MINKSRWVLALVCLLITALFLLGGCAGQKPSEQDQGKEDVTPQEAVLIYNLSAEPETLDVAMATGKLEATVQMAMFEGLTRLDENSQPV
ncbi:MAG: hypothetical protein GX779_02935, partial [Clostridia bacterium]|nr:hypothetical protein [Clostridia bacterium]